MIEAEWFATNAIWPLLKFAEEAWSERKSRLFAVACCRRIWALIPAEAAKECVEVTERYADGLATPDELRDAIESSMQATEAEYRTRTATGAPWGAVERAAINAVGRVHRSREAGRWGTLWGAQSAWAFNCLLQTDGTTDEATMDNQKHMRLVEEEASRQVEFLRDIFGNPFRPVIADPAWLTSTVLALARGMYESRDFSAMPILADALQDAGCDNTDVLDHCRGDRPHVSGCWVVDLVLGKS